MESWYDEEEDILNIELEDRNEYWKSVELADGIVADVAQDGRAVALEIHAARRTSLAICGVFLSL